jgi:ABC-type transporter Mla subunit MlaD
MIIEELIHDLKQFIGATVSQQTATISQRMDRFEQLMDRFDQRLDGLDKRMDSMATKEDLKAVEGRLNTRLDAVQDAIADTLTRVTEALDTHEQVQDLERRVTRLEHHPA